MQSNGLVDVNSLIESAPSTKEVDVNSLIAPDVKKKVGGNDLNNGVSPTQLPSQEEPKFNPDNNFGLPSARQMQQQNIAPSESTVAVQPKEALQAQYNKEHIPEWNKEKADYQEKVIKATPDAIKNTAIKSLKLKGINPNNSALLNKEIQHYKNQVDDGDATVSFDKNGNAGLVKNEGFWRSLWNTTKDNVNEWLDARSFKNMNLDERVNYANNKAKEAASEYLKTKPTDAGSVGELIGNTAPTIGRYMAGAAVGAGLEAIAPETGGLSNIALKPVMSFAFNEGVDANTSGMNGVLNRYYTLKQHNPNNLSDKELMKEAQKGEDIDRLAGIGTSALFSTVGGENGGSVTGKILKKIASVPETAVKKEAEGTLIKTGKDLVEGGLGLGEKTAVVEAAKDIGHNAEGVTNKSSSDIIKDVAKVYGENAAMGIVLDAGMKVITGISKVPPLIKSTLKYDIVKNTTPEQVQGVLQKAVNENAITPEQAQTAETKLNEFGNALKTVPDFLPDEAKASVAGLVLKRENIVKQSEGLDKTAKELIKPQIESIDNQIKEIYRTGKPLQSEIDPTTGTTYEKPTYDATQKERVQNVAEKIAKGKKIDDPEDLQAQEQFPDELNNELEKIKKSETPKEDEVQSDAFKNVNKYLKQNEKENQVPQPETQTSPTNEGANQTEQPTEIEKENLAEQQPVPSKEPIAEPKDINTTDYRGEHQIVTPLTTADNLEGGGSGFEWKFSAQDWEGQHYKESLAKLKSIKDKPDAEVTIYRAVPKGVKDINEGDWISLSKTYAKEHGMHETDASKDMPVISKKVKAKDIGWDGNDLNEFVYNPKKAEQQLSKEPISEPTNKEENKPVDNEQHRGKLMDMLYNMKDSKFGERIDAVISQKEREKGVDDLKAGKDSAAARKVKDLLDNIIKEGTIPFIRGRGGQTERFDIPMKDWFTEPLNEKELNAAESLDDLTASIINDEGINIKNIDNLKHLFNGFPYTEEDFNKIKSYLSRESESNAKSENAAKESNQKINIETKNNENATDIRSNTGQSGSEGDAGSGSKNESSENIQLDEKNTSKSSETKQQAGAGQPPINEEKAKDQGKEEISNEPPDEGGGAFTTDKGEGIGITHEQTSELRKEHSFEPYEKDPQKQKEWEDKAKENIKNGKMPSLLRKMRDGDEISPVEQKMMGFYIANLNDEVIKNPSNENINALRNAIELSDVVGGRQIGQSLVARQGTFLPDDALGTSLIAEMESLGVRELPDDLKQKVVDEYNEIAKLKEQLSKAQEENERLRKENAAKENIRNNQKSKKVKKTHQDYVNDRKTYIEEIKEAKRKHEQWLKDNGIQKMGIGITLTPEMVKGIAKIVKSYGDEGLSKLEDIINKTYEDVKDVIDGISKSDILDVMAGVHNEKKETRNELAAKLRDFKTEAVLLKKLQDLRLGKETSNKKAALVRSARIEELKNKIAEIRKRRKDENPIEGEDSGERLKTKRNYIENQISKIQKDIKEGKFEKEIKKHPPILDKKTQALQDRLIELETQQAIRRAKNDYEKMSWWNKAADTFWQITGLRRLVNAAVDFSLPFRQGVTVTLNPLKIKTTIKAFYNMFDLSFAPEKFKRFQYNLEKSELGRTFAHFGGVLSNPTEVKMERREEEFANSILSRLHQKIELGSNETLKKAAAIADKLWFSERAAAGYINTVRIEEFAKQVKVLKRQGLTPENSPEAYKDAVKWVMNMTGRGNLLKLLEDSHSGRVAANRTYFGARLMAAKVNMLNPITYVKLSPEVRVQAFKDMAGFTSGLVMAGMAGIAAGGTVSFNPDDPDFLQLRFGDKVFDLTGGSVAYVRTFLRVIKAVGKHIKGGRESASYTRFAGSSVMKSLVENKLAPNTSYVYHWWKGKGANYDDNGHLMPFNPYEIIQIYPLYVPGAVQAYQKGGLGDAMEMMIPDLFGVGTQQYEKRGGSGGGGGAQEKFHPPKFHPPRLKAPH